MYRYPVLAMIGPICVRFGSQLGSQPDGYESAADYAERVIEGGYPAVAIGLTTELARPLRQSARWAKLANMMNLRIRGQ